MKEKKQRHNKSLFNLNNKWLLYMEKIFDFMCLNLIFCISCLPILTIGIAKLALYSCLVERMESDSESLISDYFRYFKRFSIIGFKVGCLELLTFGIIAMDLFLIWSQTNFLFQVFKVICFCCLFLLILVFIYTYPMISQSPEPLFKIFKRSMLQLSQHILFSFSIIFMITLLLFFILSSSVVLLVVLSFMFIIGISCVSYGFVYFMRKYISI
ncbi:DUF624 domain-containing protein [Streptococcus parauberis]|uniref:DUF624 domain-containing protein n=1 Tax=Streptococcus parauberis TaxID=1348 RepID=UPI000CCE1518|nr:hypothetical protein ASN86_00117 [Streptococcus parauberis]